MSYTKPVIKSIEFTVGTEVRAFEVGKDFSKIVDNSTEADGGYITTLYEVYTHANNLAFAIENCPVLLTFVVGHE